MILALLLCGIVLAGCVWVIAWAIQTLFAMSALKRRYKPWQDWTITFRRLH